MGLVPRVPPHVQLRAFSDKAQFGCFVGKLATVMADAADYDPRYIEGIEHFNKCDFFESHESWEEMWTDEFGPSRKFLQGLIQAAVALHHFGNGNIRGAKKLYYGCRGYLEHYRPRYMGLDLEQFLAQMQSCFSDVIASQEEFPRIDIVPDRIPEIHLDPPPADRAE